MRRRIGVALAGTALALAGTLLAVPTALQPAFPAGRLAPCLPGVLGFQPVWSVGSASPKPRWDECVVYWSTATAASPPAAMTTTFISGVDDAYAYATIGPTFLGIRWASSMTGGYVYWPLLLSEHALILLVAATLVAWIRRRDRRRYAEVVAP